MLVCLAMVFIWVCTLVFKFWVVLTMIHKNLGCVILRFQCSTVSHPSYEQFAPQFL